MIQLAGMNVKFYKFCPICKTKISHKKDNVFCSKCKFTAYNNQAGCASSLPVKNGKVLLCVRKKDPYKGEFDLIGGFLEPLEHPKLGAIRETKEETGLDVKVIHELGIYPDIYGEGGQYTIGWNYIVKIVGGKMQAKDDVAKLVWIAIGDIPNLKLKGFKNTKEALQDLYKLYVKTPKMLK